MLSINQCDLRRFRRRACTACGDRIEITAFEPIKHKGGPQSCDYQMSELDRVREKIRERGRIVLGSIHSHCGHKICAPTDTDNGAALKDSETVFGILNIKVSPSGRKRTSVTWWPVQAPLSAEYFQPI